jgi:hypothetical protein
VVDPSGGPVVTSEADPLVVLIRSQPGMADRLLAMHADDGHGHCRVCTQGAQAGRYSWPCTIALAADTALLAGGATADLPGVDDAAR